MDRTSFINKYSRFDTPDIADRIAEVINKYIAYDGIEYLHGREIHGRHTGYLDVSSGGFRNDHDFLCPVLSLCRVDCRGIVSADIRKIKKHLNLTQALEWNPVAMCNVLKSRYTESKGMSDESDIYVVSLAIGFESAEDLPLDDLDYFYLLDCDRKEIRCYEKMFRIDAHDLASLPPYRILKWRNPLEFNYEYS